MKQAMETESRSYSDMMFGLIATIVTLTVTTTTLVTGVVITTQIRQQARDFGVLKALGFTSGQLRRQILAGLLQQCSENCLHLVWRLHIWQTRASPYAGIVGNFRQQLPNGSSPLFSLRDRKSVV